MVVTRWQMIFLSLFFSSPTHARHLLFITLCMPQAPLPCVHLCLFGPCLSPLAWWAPLRTRHFCNRPSLSDLFSILSSTANLKLLYWSFTDLVNLPPGSLSPATFSGLDLNMSVSFSPSKVYKTEIEKGFLKAFSIPVVHSECIPSWNVHLAWGLSSIPQLMSLHSLAWGIYHTWLNVFRKIHFGVTFYLDKMSNL